MKKKTLLEIRKERHIKQKTIIELMNVDRKTVYNWENCVTAPDHWQLQKLCQFYGIKKSELILADRHDPWAYLPEDTTYEQWKADRIAWIKETLPPWMWDNWLKGL